METLKKLKKHDHTLTDIIKAFIFGLVLLAPCFAILTKCLYVINNKNANQSYSEQIISKQEKLPNNTPLINSQTYIASFNNSIDSGSISLSFSQSSIDFTQLFSVSQVDRVALYSNGYIYSYYWNGSTFVNNGGKPNTWGVDILSFQFVYKDFVSTNYYETGKTNIYLITLTVSKLDNAFYYAVDEMKDSELFGWTKDTAIYTAVNGMCSGLAVQDGALPVLITYWTLMTAIYIILDIVIFVFKKITHFMQ